MANKMISEEELRDDFLSTIIRSEKPVKAPKGFSNTVMNRIGILPSLKTIGPYTPPAWLKWGVPGILGSCLILLLIWVTTHQSDQSYSGLSIAETIFKKLNTWLTEANIDVHIPDFNFSDNTSWVLLGTIILFWGFLLLYQFLDKKTHHRSME